MVETLTPLMEDPLGGLETSLARSVESLLHQKPYCLPKGRGSCHDWVPIVMFDIGVEVPRFSVYSNKYDSSACDNSVRSLRPSA